MLESSDSRMQVPGSFPFGCCCTEHPSNYVQLSNVLEHPDHLCNSCTMSQRGGKQNISFCRPDNQQGTLQPILAASAILRRLVSQNASLLCVPLSCEKRCIIPHSHYLHHFQTSPTAWVSVYKRALFPRQILLLIHEGRYLASSSSVVSSIMSSSSFRNSNLAQHLQV